MRLGYTGRLLSGIRSFSSTPSFPAMNRTIYFQNTGDPSSVLSVTSFPTLPAPSASSINLKLILASINPSDLNVVQGIYRNKPSPSALTPLDAIKGQPVYIPGNEGVAQVEDVGSDVKGLSKGDWVIFAKQQPGTWSSAVSLLEHDVIKISRPDGLTAVHAATLSVNPVTAYLMLKNFVDLKPGDWVLQNGGNSAVGQAVIQIAAARGLKTINFVRKRENLEQVEGHLKSLGADHILTYDDLEDKSLLDRVKEWTGGKNIPILLNCIGDKSTVKMFRLLGPGAQIITYGAMAKTPLEIPSTAFIFDDLVFRGFWRSRWFVETSPEERTQTFTELIKMISEGKLKEPVHDIVTISGKDDDVTATRKVRDLIQKVVDGSYGKKVLMRLESVDN